MAFKGSGRCCAVIGCSNSVRKLHIWKKELCKEHHILHEDCPCLMPFNLHFFPRDENRKMKWISAVNRKDYVPSRYSVVCSVHFVDRKPTPANPYPTLRLDNPYIKGTSKNPAIKKKILAVQDVQRSSPNTGIAVVPTQRRKSVFTSNVAEPKFLSAKVTNPDHIPPAKEGTRRSTRLQDDTKRERARKLNISDRFLSEGSEDERENVPEIRTYDRSELMELDGTEMDVDGQYSRTNINNRRNSDAPETSDASTQWEDMGIYPSTDHSYSYANRNAKKVSTITSSGFQCSLLCFTSKLMNDSDLYFYAGLPKGTFGRLVKLLQAEGDVETFQMTLENQILLVLVRLRLGLLLGDLSRRFNVSTLTVTRVILYWLPIMVEELGKLIIWLPRESIQDTLPECFQNTYPETTCVLGCIELLVEKPENHCDEDDANNNKDEHGSTYKCLVAVSPDGTIMFVSDCYSNQFTNNYIVENCGILTYLSIGDEVITSEGFMEKGILPADVKHTVPSVEELEPELSTEGSATSDICKVKMHAQKVTSRLKKFRILNSCVPLQEGTSLDDILIVCAALCNLQPRAVDS